MSSSNPSVHGARQGTGDEGPILEHLRCPSCGYDLCGLIARRCPECGGEFVVGNLLPSAQKRGWVECLRAPWPASILLVMGILYSAPWCLMEDRLRSFPSGGWYVACVFLPFSVLLAGGVLLFDPVLYRKAVAVASIATTAAILRYATHTLTHPLSRRILLGMEQATLWWGFAIMGVLVCKIAAILYSRTAYRLRWRRCLVIIAGIALLVTGANVVLHALCLRQWGAGDLILAHVLLSPAYTPVGIALAWLWGMPLLKPIDFSVVSPRWRSHRGTPE